MKQNVIFKPGCVFVSAEAGDMFQCLGIGRQTMGLRILQHLQAMLNRAKEDIGLSHFESHCLADHPRLRQILKGATCGRIAQRRISAAGDQLLGLHEEFNLANTPKTKFQIVP